VLARGEDIVPSQTKRQKYLEGTLRAADVRLAPADLARIDAELPPVAGDRYDRTGTQLLNQ
jgi:hypothetical protein